MPAHEIRFAMPAGVTRKKPKMLDTIRKMELLWNELADGNQQFPSPAWHQEELARTEEDLVTGKIKLLPWSKVKNEIRKRIK